MAAKIQLPKGSDHKMRLFQILGALFIIDGISLLWRGIVGGLFLLHESSSVMFIIIYISHVYLGGSLYAYLGYGLFTNKTWVTKLPGYLLGISSIIWAFPSFGADYFTAMLGASYLLIMGILKRKENGIK